MSTSNPRNQDARFKSHSVPSRFITHTHVPAPAQTFLIFLCHAPSVASICVFIEIVLDHRVVLSDGVHYAQGLLNAALTREWVVSEKAGAMCIIEVSDFIVNTITGIKYA
jgi:hypothetical protein